MIATLATGYVLATATLLANRSFSTYRVSPALAWFATGRVAGVPVIVVAALAATALVGLPAAPHRLRARPVRRRPEPARGGTGRHPRPPA